ncbi:MAG: FtsQ-type POTRA domain-containing protein [Syntrophales bacterium]|nr:FtsQ-type POTRA domain-containing protein [Syntrophales bacterium]
MSKKYKKSFKTKKKKSANRFFGLGIIFLILSGGLTYLLIFSSVFQIKKIYVVGCEDLSSEEIKNIISERTNSNIFLVNLNIVGDYLLNKYPKIAKANIKRKLPNAILAEIEERKPVVALKNEEFYLIDKEGVAFEKTSDIPANIPEVKKEVPFEIELGRPIIEKEVIDSVLKIAKNLTIPAKEILIVSKNRIDLITADGFTVYFNPEKNLDWQVEQLAILLKEEISAVGRKNIIYIDLRFNKIYVKKSN